MNNKTRSVCSCQGNKHLKNTAFISLESQFWACYPWSALYISTIWQEPQVEECSLNMSRATWCCVGSVCNHVMCVYRSYFTTSPPPLQQSFSSNVCDTYFFDLPPQSDSDRPWASGTLLTTASRQPWLR